MPQLPSDIPQPPPRVVYLIASHVHPEQIARLVRACRSGSPESRVLIHHDYSVSHLDPKLVEPSGNVDILLAEKAVGWGGFGLTAVMLRCMRWLLDRREFDWVVPISGQDYPIRPLADIERDLARSPHDGYLLATPVENVSWDDGAGRYLYRFYEVPKIRGYRTLRQWVRHHQAARLAKGKLPYLCVAPRDGFLLGVRALTGPFGKSFRCHKGSTWWTLNRKCVQHIVTHAEQNPRLIKHYRRTQFAPDESLFATILQNNPALKLITDDHRRFIRWSHRETGHPDLLTTADFEAMTTSGKDFARKIDSRRDPKLLDLLDAHLGIG